MFRPTATRRLLITAAAIAISVPASAQAPTVNGWGIPATDVAADPSIKLGRLANGMRYAILRNSTPKGAASVRLRFEFGSLGEAENELGLAHFIEHMAFNGSTNVPEGEMVRILERQGLAFGPDTNAHTAFDETTYELEVPKADAEHIDTVLMLLRETASEVKFDPAAVDRERGVILGEKRSRDNFGLRQFIDQLAFIAPQTLYGQRFPIGTDEVLKTATADTMKALYRRYYRPENATLVFVGDADPAEIEAKIKAKFGDWKGVGPIGAPLPFGTVDATRPQSIDTFIDPAVPTRVTFSTTRPWSDPADTQAERRTKLIDTIATGMFSKRLTRIVNAPNSPLVAAVTSNQDLEKAGLISSVILIAKDGDWSEALAISEQEIRRALEYGFTKTEFERQMAEAATAARTAAEQANTRQNAAIAANILESVASNDVVTTPAWRLDHFNKVAPTITLAEVNAAFAKLWTGSKPLIHISDKQAVDVAAVSAKLAESQKVAVTRPAEDAKLAFAYDNFGPAGKIVEDKVIADLGIRTIRFANNVRLNIKKTDFEAGKVRYSVRMAGGGLALPNDKPGMGVMLSILSSIGATSKHSMEDLRTLLAGKIVTPGVAVADDAIVAIGQTTPADLALQMKISTAYMIDPGFRPEASSQWANLVPIIDKQVKAQAQSVLQAKAAALLANDWRFGLPDAAMLSQRSLAEARPLLAPLIASAPIEIGIVGDIDEGQAIAAVAQAFGALPTRAATEPSYATARKAMFRKERTPIELTHEGSSDQALVAAYWPTSDDGNYREEVGMTVLGAVVQIMLTDSIREKLGASYNAQVVSDMSDVYQGFGLFSANTVVAPTNFAAAEAAIAEAMTELRTKPVSADLLARARNPILEQVAKTDRENPTWLSFVDEGQGRPDRLDRYRQRKAMYEAVTSADIQALANKYLDPKAAQIVHIRPATAK